MDMDFNNDTERSVEISRLIKAPIELVWKVMTEPEHQNKWWGPEGFRNVDVTMDFRVGGEWTFTMIGPDGTKYPNHVVFKEIVPPTRWVSDHGDGQRVWFESTVTLHEIEGETLVTITHLFPTKASRDEVVEKYGAIEGGHQHLAKLEKYLQENML